MSRDSLIRGAGRCSAGFLCTGIQASSSALWSAQGFAGSPTQWREDPHSRTADRCPSTRSDVTILQRKECRCPAAAKQAEDSFQQSVESVRTKPDMQQGSGHVSTVICIIRVTCFLSGAATICHSSPIFCRSICVAA